MKALKQQLSKESVAGGLIWEELPDTTSLMNLITSWLVSSILGAMESATDEDRGMPLSPRSISLHYTELVMKSSTFAASSGFALSFVMAKNWLGFI